jgi:hypothetical protein
MAKCTGAQHHLSDFQEFILANLKQQARLKDELARIERTTSPSERIVFVPRMTQLLADLAALRLAMNLRRNQENRDTSRRQPNI